MSGQRNKYNWTGPVNVVEGPFKHLPFLVREVRSIRDEPLDEIWKIFATLAGPHRRRTISEVRHLPRGQMLWKRRRILLWAGVSSAVTTMVATICRAAPLAAMSLAKFRWAVALLASAIRVRHIRDAAHIPLSGRVR